MFNLDEIISKSKHLIKEGKVADYIPALSAANPNDIGVYIVDLKGNIYKAGDYSKKFTMQSISKVISFMIAIMDHGQDYVFDRVGRDYCADAFNTFSGLDLPNISKPSNPMINIGAILTTSLIKGQGKEKINRILELTRYMAQNPKIEINYDVFLSEKETGDRNRAMAYLLKSKGLLNDSVTNTLDTYFAQCSIELNAMDLAKIGEFIASGCNNNRELMKVVIEIMKVSGMYNYSNEYMKTTNIPSKSGVGGGIMGVIPQSMGIGVYSPALDRNGNSIAGIEIMKEISRIINK